MILYEKEIEIPFHKSQDNLLSHFKNCIKSQLDSGDIPIRFVVTKMTEESYQCEVGILSSQNVNTLPLLDSIFTFRKRLFESVDKFNVVLIVPTGIGAAIGGDSGDASAVARLIASMCDNLITHPNVVNAADINELPENGLYIEGSILSRLIMGTVGLQKVRGNRVLLIIDNHEDDYFTDSAINSASAARVTLGLDCSVIKTNSKICMESEYSLSGRATGKVTSFDLLVKLLNEHRNEYDALAITSVINVPEQLELKYFAEDIVNPWGGVEAILTHAVSLIFDIPSAHSPMIANRDILNAEFGVVDPCKAAEAVSLTSLHCILKGLYKSPRIVKDPQVISQSSIISVEDISCIIIPDGCVGLPTLAAMVQGIPVIVVKENTNNMKNNLNVLPFREGNLLWADNYLEAVGLMGALKSGIIPETVRRPLKV